jgi:hypothetical protein
MSIRESVIENIVDVLTDMNDPKPILVSREPFDVEKLAITQYPAILVQSGPENRTDFSMRGRTGSIVYNIRAFVRGTELDKKKNDIAERIEETLDTDRLRGTDNLSMRTQVITITPVERLAPLGEVIVTVQVDYKYTRGTT